MDASPVLLETDPTWLRALAPLVQERCGVEPAHDYLHVARVTRTARALARSEGAMETIAVAAAFLHELFNYPKGHPDSALSGEVCAEHARRALLDVACPEELREPIAYAIAVHPFSRGIRPETLEGRILQDADRLDSIGAIGVARCFATCADMKRPFYAEEDPFCARRAPDDKLWGLDHVYRKLLRIPETLHTHAAKQLAEPRTAFLHRFLEALADEVGGGPMIA